MSYTLGATDLSPAKALQAALKSAGYYTGAVDGDLGPASAKAAGAYVERAVGLLAGILSKVRGKMPMSDIGVADRVTKFVSDTVSITIPNAVRNRDFGRLDSALRGTLSLSKVLDAYSPGVFTADARRSMALNLGVASDPRMAPPAQSQGSTSLPLPGGTVELPGGMPVPKLALVGAAVLVAWFALKG